MPANNPRVKGLVEGGTDQRSPAPLTDAQIMLERIEEAMLSGTPVKFRRRILAEAAAFIRQHHVTADRSAA